MYAIRSYYEQRIEDPKVLRERNVTKDSNGIGLGNVINRLRLYFDREEIFEITSEGQNKGTKVTIHIPKNNESVHNFYPMEQEAECIK